MIRRLNDLDLTGWISLLIFIPFIDLLLALFLIFAPGSEGNNRYGAAPCENSAAVKIMAALFPIIFIAGTILALIKSFAL